MFQSASNTNADRKRHSYSRGRYQSALHAIAEFKPSKLEIEVNQQMKEGSSNTTQLPRPPPKSPVRIATLNENTELSPLSPRQINANSHPKYQSIALSTWIIYGIKSITKDCTIIYRSSKFNIKCSKDESSRNIG